MADDRPWAAATTDALTAWPDIAAPLVDALATGATPIPAVPADAVDALTAVLADRMLQVAEASAQLTARDAAAQGVDNPSGIPDRARVEHVAATFAGLIADGYASAATQAALGVPLTEAGRLKAAASAVAAAVRAALTTLGTATSGLVPTYVGAAMTAAEHEGQRAVAEAHPPLYLVADEHDDLHACAPCREVAGRRYDTVDAALEDYPTVGYRLCLGGVRCRGKLRTVWREPAADAALTEVRDAPRGTEPRIGGGRRMTAPLVEGDLPEHTGAMLALVPAEQDAARLAVAGGEDPSELHLTLAYLGNAAAINMDMRQQLLDDLTAAVNGLPVIDGAAFGAAVFNPAGPEPCRVILAGGDWLDGVHHFLMDMLRLPVAVDRHAPWVPHITLAYDGDLSRLDDLVGRLGPVRFDRVRLAFGGQNVDIPLVDAAEDDADVDADEPDGDWALVESAGDGNSLRTYFTANPKGLRRWAGKPHPWTALFKILRKHLDPERAKRVTSAWYIRVFHHTPNQNRGKVLAAGHREATEPFDDRSGGAPMRSLAERFDPSQPRNPHTGEWSRVLAAAELKVGRSKLRLTHHGDGRVSVHDEHGGALHLTREDLKGGQRSGDLRRFAFAGPLNTEHVGDRDWMTKTEDRGGRPWTTVHAGLQKTHVAGEHDPNLHDADEPYLNDRHTLHLPAGAKGVDDPEELFARSGTSMTTQDLHDFADTLRSFADGHEDVDTGHGRVTMGVTGKDFTFDTGKRGEQPIVLNRGEVRNVNKALHAAYEAYNPDDGDPLPAGEHFKQTIPTKHSGNIVVTRTGPDSDFWIESDFTAIRVTPDAFLDVTEHLDDLLALAGDVRHLTPVPVRPVTESQPTGRVDLVEAGRVHAF